MHKDEFESRWKQVRGEVQGWWWKITDEDLDNVAGQYEVFVGLLQERYGYSREHAEQEIEKQLNDYESWLKKRETTNRRP